MSGFFTHTINLHDNFPQTRDFLTGMAKANNVDPPSEDEIKQIAQRYQNDIARMKSTYGFTDATMMSLHEEFAHMSEAILETLKNDPTFKDQLEVYQKYLRTYPYLYFSLIPREVLESRLAAKCVEDNMQLRIKLAKMNKCLSDLVHQISDLQEMAGIPPIAKVVFAAIPDPIIASESDEYKKYSGEVDTYHQIFEFFNKQENKDKFQQFLISPVTTIGSLTNDDVSDDVSRAALIKMLTGLTSGKGCIPQPGDNVERDENGNLKEEPPVPASRCGEGAVRLGNPETEGSKKTYVAKKGTDGKVVWEMFGKGK